MTNTSKIKKRAVQEDRAPQSGINTGTIDPPRIRGQVRTVRSAFLYKKLYPPMPLLSSIGPKKSFLPEAFSCKKGPGRAHFAKKARNPLPAAQKNRAGRARRAPSPSICFLNFYLFDLVLNDFIC
ncbi:MAG TPA: hypothetical protein PKV62_03815, partial [Oscillospiraceae bacterium]|nr:hypothetical protein [Oscillospiraceae bacterium]